MVSGEIFFLEPPLFIFKNQNRVIPHLITVSCNYSNINNRNNSADTGAFTVSMIYDAGYMYIELDFSFM